MSLIEFLLARIAEDEKLARACHEKTWRYDDGVETSARDSRTGWPVVQHAHVWGPNVTITTSAVHAFPDMQHIANWDPARVLAECEAKRHVIGLHHEQHECVGDKYGKRDTILVAEGYLHENCPTLLLLALPYSDRPDYREEWRP